LNRSGPFASPAAVAAADEGIVVAVGILSLELIKKLEIDKKKKKKR
jgi:hypothetical protein